MHKDKECGIVVIDETDGILKTWRSNGSGEEPFLGNADLQKMKKWWMQRAVPGNRRIMEEVIKESDCNGTYDYLAKNLGLSMTDTYWLCPVDSGLQWENVSLRRQVYINDGKMPYHNFTSYDPNASLNGQMEKYWDLTKGTPMLVKTAPMHYGQQSINEIFATMIHHNQNTNIPYVSYSLSQSPDGNLQSICEAFTTEDIEFIPAFEIIESRHVDNDKSLYDAFIEICAENGIDKQAAQDFMDYQTQTDFIISNDDEHLLNFGVRRNVNTNKLIGMAPIFDSGNSMFYAEDTRQKPFSEIELLERKTTGFYSTEEKMIKNIQNRNIVKADLLPDKKDVYDLYASNGVPETKAKMISDSYENKLSLLYEFQQGKTISLYHEKSKAKFGSEHLRTSVKKEARNMFSGNLPKRTSSDPKLSL